MHAVILPVTFNDPEAAIAELPGVVEPVSGTPGFVAGYWISLPGDRGNAIVVLESEEAANALADMARSAPYEAVTPGEIEVGEVVAHA
jgi:hypothetical protein